MDRMHTCRWFRTDDQVYEKRPLHDMVRARSHNRCYTNQCYVYTESRLVTKCMCRYDVDPLGYGLLTPNHRLSREHNLMGVRALFISELLDIPAAGSKK